MSTRHALRIASAVLALGAATVFACSSDHPAAGGSSSGQPNDASSGGPGDDENPPDSGNDGASALPFGKLPTIDEPSFPCVATTATKQTVFTAADSGGLGGPAIQVLSSL